MAKKKKGKQQKKQAPPPKKPVDDLIGLDADEEDPPSDSSASNDAPAAPGPVNAFAMLGDDDDDDEEEEEDSDGGAAAAPAPANAFAMLGDDDDDDDDEDEEEESDGGAAAPAPANAFAMLGDDDDDDDNDDDDEEEEEKVVAPKQKSKKNNKKKNNNKAEAEEDDDLDDILADLAGDKNDDQGGGKSKKKSKKKKGKNNKKKNKEEEDLDDILADIEAAGDDNNNDDDDDDGDDDDDEQDESKMTKAQLKRKRKKERQRLRKQGLLPDPAEETKKADEEDGKGGKKKTKKQSKRAKAMQAIKERLEAQKAEEEALRKEMEEKARLAEERARLAEEERQRKLAEEEERKRRKAEERERLRREGKLLSKKQRQAQAKKEAFAAQLRKQGVVPADTDAAAAAARASKQSRKSRKQAQEALRKKKEQERLEELERVKEAARVKQEEERLTISIKEQETHIHAINVQINAIEAGEISDVDLSSDEEGAANAPEPSEESVADDWDASSSDDEDADGDKGADAEEDTRTAKEKRREAKMAAKRAAKDAKIEALRAEIAAAEATIEEARKGLADIEASRASDEKAQRAEEEKRQREQAEREKRKEQERLSARAEVRKNQGLSEEIVDSEDEDDGKESNLRSPICCILGHVDTGKTKLLDKIRSTNVQDKEAGGITQQIGATYFPMSAIKSQTKALNKTLKKQLEYKLPGLLVIDTPGHESFTNLRSRGSNLCDIAILVVDIMHGLEPQTLESIDLLKRRKTPFVVALNKIDRIYDWQATPYGFLKHSLGQQGEQTLQEFKQRVSDTIVAFAEQGLNCCLYYENKDFQRNISLVPTSAITGEGIPDMLMLLVQLTQNKLSQRLSYIAELQCTVLEVKVIEGLGTTIDVVLVNGYLHENDTIVVCGMSGPIVTNIRALLTPQPLKELRVRGEYVHHKRVMAAMGIKISAAGLEDAVAGTQLLVCGPDDDVEELKDEVQQDLATILSKVDKSGRGVCVQASTLGSLEALLAFLQDAKIPVSGINIGPVHKKDVVRAAIMLAHKEEYATILAFDVAVTKDAQELAAREKVKIFTADIIYHLFDSCTAYFEEVRRRRQDAAAAEVVFPVELEILQDHIYHTNDPMVLGVRVKDGFLRKNTPICAATRRDPQTDKPLLIGHVVSMEKNLKEVNEGVRGDELCIKIYHNHAPGLTYGRHYDYKDRIVSHMSRRSIDLLKDNFKDELEQDDWRLVIKIKRLLDIM